MGFFDDILAQNTQAQQMAVRVGASTYADPKIITGMTGRVFNRLLLPTDLDYVISQGATNEQILLAAWGACGTATGETFTVANPYLGSQTNDSYGLQIPSAPTPGDRVRVTRHSLTSSRVITHRQGMPQKRQPFVQEITNGKGIIIKQYGTYSYVDSNGVTHQPPGKRDPVVNAPQVGANIDNDTIKFDDNGRMYADFFGTGGGTGLGSAGTSVNGLNAGHGIEIIPGFSPTDSPTLTIEVGGSVPAGTYQWAYCYVIDTKRTPLSPSVAGTTIDGPPTTYHQPHLLIPAKPDIIHATALELYRKDAGVGANGTVQTKFAYTSSPGVLITDPSTAATKIMSGAYTGMYQYTVVSTHSGVDKGDEFEYNPLVRVKAGDPPIPYDPRDGSLTTLIESGANDGSSIFKTSDGGAFNQVTGAITYPTDNPLNHSGFRLVDTLTPSASPQDYIDTKTDAALGILFQRDPTVINIKPARYLVAPFSSMSPVTGTVPPLYELSGLTFSSSNPAVSNDGVAVNPKYGVAIDKNNFVDVLLSASLTIPTAGQGAQTTSTVPGYDAVMYKKAGLKFQGASGRELAVAFNPATLELDSQDQLNVISGGTFTPYAVSMRSMAITPYVAVGTTTNLTWTSVEIDHGGWVAAGTQTGGPDIVIPATAAYRLSTVFEVSGQSSFNVGDVIQLKIKKNGTNFFAENYPIIATDSDTSTTVFTKNFDFTVGDVIHLAVQNSTSVGIAVLGTGTADLDRVA